MFIQMTCSCGRRLQVGDQDSGKSGKCPACGAVLEIPTLIDDSPGSPGAEVHSLAPEVLESPSAPPAGPDYTPTPPPPQTSLAVPLAEMDDVRLPPYRLHSPGQVALITFLLGPVGGLLLLAVNYYRLGKSGAVWATVVFALFLSGAMLAVAIASTTGAPMALFGLTLFLVLWGGAAGLQGDTFKAHLRRGGDPASFGAALGLGLLGLLLLGGIIIGGVAVHEVVFNSGLGEKRVFGPGEEVYYQAVPREDADRLGQFLQREGFFDGRGPKTVVLKREGGSLVVAFVVNAAAVKKPQVIQEFREFGRQLSQQVFGGQPVEIHLCDEYLSVLSTVR
jgi:hypothetical protein